MQKYLRHPGSLVLRLLCLLSGMITGGALLLVAGYVLVKGVPYLKPSLFALEYNSENVSMLPALINTVWMTVLALAVAAPLGIGGAIYLVEYAPRNSRLVRLVRVTAETLSGIPSILYGLFGMILFVTALRWRYSVLSGALTLAIMVLPLILRTTEEALLSVPDSYREGSLALGAGKLRTVMKVVLPPASGGIFAGIILAIGAHCGRDRRADLHGGHRGEDCPEPHVLRFHAGGACVCALRGGAARGRSLCHRGGADGDCIPDERAFQLDCQALQPQ